MKRISALLCLLATVEAIANVGSDSPHEAVVSHCSEKKAPNFVFIMTDDQDLQLGSLSYMPLLSKHLRDQGTFFSNHFVTTAICCPSRVSLWTGRQAHNNNVTDVVPPYGGYPKFIERGFNDNFLPVWLQQAGYNTYYAGKLFNAHTTDNYNSPWVNGFNGSDFLLDPHCYSYLHPTYQRNRDPPVNYEDRHTTDLLAEKTLGFLEEALGGNAPFFLGIAPVAPHSNHEINSTRRAPIPQERYKHLFEDVKVPRGANFNPDKPSGASWISKLRKLNSTEVEYGDFYYRSRLQVLQGIDELVDSVMSRLESSGQLDNTYIIYTSDNGYHISQHRLPPGKTCGFEEDIRVPMFIRGPGIGAGFTQDAVTTHIDIAPTLFNLAGIPLRQDFDGAPIPLTSRASGIRHEHVTVEYWGTGDIEGIYGSNGPSGPVSTGNNTYKAVRLVGADYSLYYSVWCTNEHELYDLKTDPYQINDLYGPNGAGRAGKPVVLLGRPLQHIINRLDALLLVLKSCQGKTCIEPWNVLHHQGHIRSLSDAIHPRFDDFYANQSKVSFSWCALGYIKEAEGPQVSLTTRDGLSWDEWT